MSKLNNLDHHFEIRVELKMHGIKIDGGSVLFVNQTNEDFVYYDREKVEDELDEIRKKQLDIVEGKLGEGREKPELKEKERQKSR